MISRRRFAAGALGLLAAPRLAAAQSAAAWPQERPVEIIVLANAGGPVDAMTRLIMPHVAERVPGMRFIVNNRPGAGGQIGLEATFNAAPDGYTLGATSMPVQQSMPLERPTRYRAMGFTFIANIVDDANAFYVHADSPIRSVRELVAAAKARPGQLSCATTGIGSDDHLFLMAFENLAGLSPLVHVPFTGSAPLLAQLLGGHLDVAAINIHDGIAQIREGKLRALAAAAPQRVPAVPDVPTMRELGFDLVMGAARGILGPPNLPPAIVRSLEGAFAGALADPGFQRDAARNFMPLRPLIGGAYLSMAQETDDMVRDLWQKRPWRER
jgi:tripartite-type tricarboxylate transporter receptor subunit TctC